VTVATKARALLSEARVQIRFATDQLVAATVAGDHDVYEVRWDSFSARWECSCPELRGRCSHVEAVKQVTCSAGRVAR
jgi:hypothetical protein